MTKTALSLLRQTGLEAALVTQLNVWLKKHVSKNTKTNYAQAATLFCGYHQITTAEQFVRIQPKDVIAFRDHLIDDMGFANRTVNNRLAVISSAYQFLKSHQAIRDNPVEIVERLAVDDSVGETPAMSEKQVRRFLDAPDRATPQGVRDYALLCTLIYTGCRISEPASMGTKSLFTDQGVACIKWKKKGGANLSLPVHPELQIALHGYFAQFGHDQDRASALFLPIKGGNNKGGSLQSRALKNIFYKHRDASGLGPEYTPHSTRATFATTAIKNGARIEDVQKALGHAYISTTQSYIHKIEDLKDSPVMCLKF